MGKRGLYMNQKSTAYVDKLTKNYMDFLQYSDGQNSISKISKLINLNFKKYFKYIL